MGASPTARRVTVNPVSLSDDDRQAFETAQARLRAILPEDYQDTYEDIQPVSMGSAGLKYGADGQVAWNEMWATFCDLAMAGGPPHKGALLEPRRAPRWRRSPNATTRWSRKSAAASRWSPTSAPTRPRSPAGSTSTASSEAMAGWLLRAIVMENVSARTEGLALALPAGPDYRLEKEIKNVVTVIAKTCHYWTGHMWLPQRRKIAALLAAMAAESPVVAPALATDGVPGGHDRAFAALADAVRRDTGLLDVAAPLRRMARRRVRRRAGRGVDDAAARGQQRPHPP